jgi:hypothetical protein
VSAYFTGGSAMRGNSCPYWSITRLASRRSKREQAQYELDRVGPRELASFGAQVLDAARGTNSRTSTPVDRGCPGTVACQPIESFVKPHKRPSRETFMAMGCLLHEPQTYPRRLIIERTRKGYQCPGADLQRYLRIWPDGDGHRFSNRG